MSEETVYEETEVQPFHGPQPAAPWPATPDGWGADEAGEPAIDATPAEFGSEVPPVPGLTDGDPALPDGLATAEPTITHPAEPGRDGHAAFDSSRPKHLALTR